MSKIVSASSQQMFETKGRFFRIKGRLLLREFNKILTDVGFYARRFKNGDVFENELGKMINEIEKINNSLSLNYYSKNAYFEILKILIDLKGFRVYVLDRAHYESGNIINLFKFEEDEDSLPFSIESNDYLLELALRFKYSAIILFPFISSLECADNNMSISTFYDILLSLCDTLPQTVDDPDTLRNMFKTNCETLVFENDKKIENEIKILFEEARQSKIKDHNGLDTSFEIPSKEEMNSSFRSLLRKLYPGITPQNFKPLMIRMIKDTAFCSNIFL